VNLITKTTTTTWPHTFLPVAAIYIFSVESVSEMSTWTRRGWSQVFITATVDQAKWSASRTDRFTPGEKKTPGYPSGMRLSGFGSRLGHYGQETGTRSCRSVIPCYSFTWSSVKHLSFFLSFFLPFLVWPLLPTHCRCRGGSCCTWSHSVTHTHSVGLLWTSDQPDAETSTWQHTTFTRDRHPCFRRDSKPKSQQANGSRPTP
jgi:hypothetical protein